MLSKLLVNNFAKPLTCIEIIRSYSIFEILKPSFNQSKKIMLLKSTLLTKFKLTLALVITNSLALPSTYANQAPQYSGVNNINFYESAYNKSFAGNGFLVSVSDKLYAITVKHTFFEARTPNMKHVDIKSYVREWRIHPKQSPQEYVLLGELLNADITETIDMKILQKDWLVFEVMENHSSLVPVSIRKSPVNKGEVLTAYGCTYANQKTCQQDNFQGQFLSYESNNLRISMENLKMDKLRGLSGSPVLDGNNQLVGIVSNVLKSKSGDGFDFAPANLTYLTGVLKKIQSKQK